MASSVLARHARALAMGPRSMASAGGLRPVFASPPCALRTLTSRGTGRRSAEGRPCAGLPALRGYGTAPEAPGGGAVSRLVQRIAAEARHTWAGMKLFATNVRISVKLLVKSNRGEPLSRRERLLLSRTGKDLFKMVPFSFFVILPGGEPFLFLYLKLFPSALPSTFMAESVPEEVAKAQVKRLPGRIASAQAITRYLLSLTDTLEAPVKQVIEKQAHGHAISLPDLRLVSAALAPRVAPPRLPRAVLVALDGRLATGALSARWHTTAFVRRRIQRHLDRLAADDLLLREEGAPARLTRQELQACLEARDLGGYFMTEQQLRDQLGLWLEAVHVARVPYPVLLLVKPRSVALQDVIRALPPDWLRRLRAGLSAALPGVRTVVEGTAEAMAAQEDAEGVEGEQGLGASTEAELESALREERDLRL